MVISTNVSVTNVLQYGKKYSWKKPVQCPKCYNKDCLWGHGYSLRRFYGLSEGVFMKRWRCQSCKTVLTTRPSGFWPRVREKIVNIYATLLHLAKYHKWPSGARRQRAGYWLNQFNLHVQLFLLNKGSLLETVSFFRTKDLPFFRSTFNSTS